MPLLEVDELHVAYGELEVVKGVSFTVERGEIVTILGSNGAGKTTLLRSL
ncbi:MAG: ATP-binding cassette domain-containing protein, partial [Pseudolabrys sp.]